MLKQRPKGHFSQVDLALAIHELLEIPLDKVKRYPSEGLKLVAIILNTISDALRRGESVEIDGFGTFKVWKPRKSWTLKTPIIYREGQVTLLSDEPQTFPGKTKIFFRPSIHLRAMLNVDSPTWKEAKAISKW